MTGELGIWLGGEQLAVLDQPRWPFVRCRYTEAALARWPANSPLISCSLPLGDKPLDATAFCAGLLPEGRTLDVISREAGISTNEILGLLDRYGRDVAGALAIAADRPEERRYGIEPFSDSDLAAAVRDLDEHPLGIDEQSELSLAGLQDKLLLVRTEDGGWGRPLRGQPSSHILKLDDRRFPGLVAAEAECLRLAKAVGLTTVDVELTKVGDADCLIVSRFDRRDTAEGLERVHQEDLCQALGIDPRDSRGRAKYERAGGPSFRQAAELLDAHAADALAELERLVAVMTYTALIGNADAHGKNLGLLHPSPTTITVAPLYDTVPTLLWPTLRADAAMRIGGVDSLLEVSLGDIVREATSWHLPAARAEEVATGTARRLAAAVAAGASSGSSWVTGLVASRCEQLLAGGVLSATGPGTGTS